MTSRNSPRAILAVALVAVLGCNPAASPPPSAPASASSTAAPSATGSPGGTATGPTGAAFEGLSYPEEGEAPCGDETYAGTLKRITAVDALTVEFELCNPDVAFLSKVAFTALGIDDAGYLEAHVGDKSYLDQPNGTGPYRLREWDKGNRLVLEAFDGYWDEPAMTPTVEFRWSDEAAQRWLELQSGTIDGIDNPGPDDIDAIKADSSVTFYPREGLNTFYLGFNNTMEPWDDVKVRQAIALGVDRNRIVDNFYPEGSEVATHFVPCAIAFGCEGEPTWEFDPERARELLAEAGFPDGFETRIQFRAAVRGYLPDPPVIATEIQQQLRDNLGIEAELQLMESGAFLDANTAGTLDGMFLLGWGADYPDATNFLDYHFGSGAGKKFGEPFPDLVEALNRGGRSPEDEERRAAYEEANNLIREYVPAVIVAHGGSGTVFRADVSGAHASPLTNEAFAPMKPGDRETLVWMQNAEPLSLYCGDETDGETLRACEQIKEPLYAYEIGGTDPVPALATSVPRATT